MQLRVVKTFRWPIAPFTIFDSIESAVDARRDEMQALVNSMFPVQIETSIKKLLHRGSAQTVRWDVLMLSGASIVAAGLSLSFFECPFSSLPTRTRMDEYYHLWQAKQ